MELSAHTREKNLKKLSEEFFDLVIVGRGISGAGVARDAASRGMKVALVDSQDFAAGTSSRSSKLIHGGIRYLENMEFGLVFEALSERSHLFEMAPHLVHPLRFMLPVYEGDRVGMFKMGLGMWLYDILSTFDAPKMHERLGVAETLRRAPYLRNSKLKGSYVYSDAYMDDDRLVLETLRSATDFGATCVSYVSAVGAEFENGKVVKIKAKDNLRGSEFAIAGRHFVSTVGPWTDSLGHQIFSDWRNIMRPSKGVHLTFHRDRVRLDQALVMVSNDQKRIVFAIPRHEMVIVGTTDTDFKKSPETVTTNEKDVTYLLQITNEYFPGANLTERDILASYSGVRPLVHDGSESESKTSREHLIFTDPRNVTFLTGGKYTTYRKMAEETVEAVLTQFEAEDRVKWARSQSLTPLNSLATSENIQRAFKKAKVWAEQFAVDVGTVNFLIERHGMEAQSILILGSKSSTYSTWRDREVAKWGFELVHAIKNTMCLNLRDFYLRRVPLFLAEKDHGYRHLEALSKIMSAELGWSDQQRLQSIAEVREHENTEMAWRSSEAKT